MSSTKFKSGAILPLRHTPSWRAQVQIHFSKLINMAFLTSKVPLFITFNNLQLFSRLQPSGNCKYR